MRACSGSGRKFQSTLPRGGATAVPLYGCCKSAISIHAPARGATGYTGVSYVSKADFNPRSRRGSDIQPIFAMLAVLEFQSTLPQGERHILHHLLGALQLFQSTLPQGERPFRFEWKACTYPFQSTLPQGERHYKTCVKAVWEVNFNPRSRRGSDQQAVI